MTDTASLGLIKLGSYNIKNKSLSRAVLQLSDAPDTVQTNNVQVFVSSQGMSCYFRMGFYYPKRDNKKKLTIKDKLNGKALQMFTGCLTEAVGAVILGRKKKLKTEVCSALCALTFM